MKKFLKNKVDFELYKMAIDVKTKCLNDHVGEPLNYPCKVYCNYYGSIDNVFVYTFSYLEKIKCKHCNHTYYSRVFK